MRKVFLYSGSVGNVDMRLLIDTASKAKSPKGTQLSPGNS